MKKRVLGNPGSSVRWSTFEKLKGINFVTNYSFLTKMNNLGECLQLASSRRKFSASCSTLSESQRIYIYDSSNSHSEGLCANVNCSLFAVPPRLVRNWRHNMPPVLKCRRNLDFCGGNDVTIYVSSNTHRLFYIADLT